MPNTSLWVGRGLHRKLIPLYDKYLSPGIFVEFDRTGKRPELVFVALLRLVGKMRRSSAQNIC